MVRTEALAAQGQVYSNFAKFCADSASASEENSAESAAASEIAKAEAALSAAMAKSCARQAKAPAPSHEAVGTQFVDAVKRRRISSKRNCEGDWEKLFR